MQKIFIILLMLVYGLSSSGMTVSLHYCCGKLDGVSLTGKQDKTCKMGNHSKKSNCCKDKEISASKTADHQAAAKWVNLANQPIALPVYYVVNTSFKDYSISIDRLARGVPVNHLKVPLFIKNCVFRI